MALVAAVFFFLILGVQTLADKLAARFQKGRGADTPAEPRGQDSDIPPCAD